jgi:hypothetical protein
VRDQRRSRAGGLHWRLPFAGRRPNRCCCCCCCCCAAAAAAAAVVAGGETIDAKRRISKHQIGDAGAAALSEALKSNATLTSLELVARALLCAGGPVSPRACLTLLSSKAVLQIQQGKAGG